MSPARLAERRPATQRWHKGAQGRSPRWALAGMVHSGAVSRRGGVRASVRTNQLAVSE